MKKMCAGLLRKFFWLLPAAALPLQAQVQTTLHSFTGTPDGFSPGSAVLHNGALFGATPGGGLNNNGLVFALGTNGGSLNPIHDFTGTSDGGQPNDVILDGGTVYGTTFGGGSSGNGIVFKVGTNGGGFTVLYNFTNLPDGQNPLAGLVLADGMLYGTTSGGGSNHFGTVFKMNTNGGNYAVLRHLSKTTDGSVPRGAPVIINATLYGTTSDGGSNSLGTVFKLNTNGTGFAAIHQFTNSPDGAYPYAGLLANSNTLYGTTFLGGSNAGGTVFRLNTNGTGFSVLRHLSSIGAPAENSDGAYVKSGLAIDNGTLYGSAAYGGTANGGTLFRLGTNGGNFSVLKNFTYAPDGANPQGVAAVNGKTVYGFTYGGGPAGGGIAFSLLLSPAITGQPPGVTVTNGDPASFTVTAADDSLISYQWYFNTNTVLAGQTNSTLNFASATNGNAGSYTVVVADKFGAVTSAPALLTVLSKPGITAQPQSLTITNGTPAAFSVTATGSGVFSYQWYFNTNTLLVGQTNNPLNFASASNSDAGTYTVVVANNLGAATSSPALLTIVSKPVITAQPQGLTITNAATATFTVAAIGVSPLKYQWFFNTNTANPSLAGIRLLNKTNATLTFTSATNSGGFYSVAITNDLGKTTSSPALLIVISKPIITTNPLPLTVINGSPSSFTVAAIGAGALQFQWYLNTNTANTNLLGSPQPGKTNSLLSFSTTSNSLAGLFSAIVSNSFGSATSSPALLTVISKPTITTNPQPVTVNNGDPATFAVGVIGAATFKYQWYFNTNTVLTNLLGSALAGRTNVTLDFSAVSNSLAGRYSVIITNTFGKATSSPALLAINSQPPPVITLQPLNASIINGDPVSFTSAATGAGTLGYQWLFRTNLTLTGATNPTLAYANANLPGVYSMKVTDSFGSATSSLALLTVSNKPLILSSAFIPASGSYSFALASLAGSTNRLWASTNLASTNFWRGLATNVMPTNALWFFTDTNTAKTNAVRFYRFSSP